ncbi:7-cyano-7-deazaguanine synthase [Ruegeria sp. YS9]|uniref:7-cyano-7-deazaguanine synthase n=1 Tax=Ruegeria sp. YS9 TaxID=2966453 RepID=UPI00214C0E22|nr:7-cyano-7-deazaguanine synthase [Ruegeria sp. YS9]UUV05883.1 7-cyano-7-deazaguanine synthase [Ruegeria sp. YS9]
MDGAAQPEHRVRLLAPLTKAGGDEVLRFDLDGQEHGVSLRISQLNRQMVAGLPDRALDLLELAALVYAVDSAVSRGGPALHHMGKRWHRRFVVEMPVRDLPHWQGAGVGQALEDLLMFLSGDRFEFTFTTRLYPDAERNRFFKFGGKSAWKADRILMFSGGLDSFAGALEEIVEQKQRTALVSHFSATKIAPVQRHLQEYLSDEHGRDLSRHVPVHIQLVGGKTREGTHRSRSFLFAVLGAMTAQAFGRDRVSFYENGIVSLNLPPVGNVLGTRATRTTHPRTLTLMTGFLSQVFDGGMRADNPFFWRTKTEVVSTIARLGAADQIRHTRSCADVHNQTKQHVHCGRCSQCIDRRFAVLAAGLESYDPEEAYRVDLLNGRRERVEDKEIALSYVRNAEQFEHLSADVLAQHYPAVLDAVGNLGEPAKTSLSMIAELLKRHGVSVAGVMQNVRGSGSLAAFPENSLPRLYGEAQRERLFAGVPGAVSGQAPARKLTIVIDRNRETATVDSVVVLAKGATAGLILVLSNAFLEAAGQGLDPFDFPAIPARRLAKMLNLSSDEGVRQRVNRSRTELGKKFASAGLDKDRGTAIIESVPGHGYRLAPDLVEVRVAPKAKPTR